ncbi:MAG: hypothetical protein RL411_1352, partial [Bacteroidota bacterium]
PALSSVHCTKVNDKAIKAKERRVLCIVRMLAKDSKNWPKL